MVDNLRTCIDLFLDSFIDGLASAQYKQATINNYRLILLQIGRVMDAEGVKPSELTPDEAERLGRMVPRRHGQMLCLHNLARRFAAHLLDIGVAEPVPLTKMQIARAELFADFESYL